MLKIYELHTQEKRKAENIVHEIINFFTRHEAINPLIIIINRFRGFMLQKGTNIRHQKDFWIGIIHALF